MNILIFTKGHVRPRQFGLSAGAIGAIAVAAIGSLTAAGFAGGYLYSAANGSGVSSTELELYAADIAEQRAEIDAIRQQEEDTLDAMSLRLAELNARIIRLDALGRRLTDMADIDDGEFDFDAEPAMGGPEEPMQSGSVEVPELVEAMAALGRDLNDREAQLGVLEGVIMHQNLEERVYPQGRPVNSGWISSYFGKRTDPFTGKPANHTGIDFAGKKGDDIVAVADGVVTWSGDRYGYGIMVEINHGNGYTTRYAHNDENLVEVGEEVRKGQIVARMGATGRATGPNLHFEVVREGRRVNPVNFIRDSQ
jgi:murein DD-endopeptidase MepM/ murein hydrolase activator NlpD